MTTSDKVTHIDWNAIGDEIITHFRNILRIDTRNPPGNETRAAEYLREVLQREGIASEIVGPSPDRGTLVARLQG
ncbi:MAG TPA: hypothetical protein VFA10_09145, partial [Ktedonobacteraceae bacterium]|nr:hypothetical protein [Ktedonobacteraceae bacterium]